MRFRFNHLLYEVPESVVDEIEIEHYVNVEGCQYADFNFVKDGEHLPKLGGTGEHGEKLPTWEDLGIRQIGPMTKSGKVLTDADIRALADEAERGYDIKHLVQREEDHGAGAG